VVQGRKVRRVAKLKAEEGSISIEEGGLTNLVTTSHVKKNQSDGGEGDWDGCD